MTGPPAPCRVVSSVEAPQPVERRDRHAAGGEVETLPTQHAAGAEQEAEKKQGKLTHGLAADQDRFCNPYHGEYPKRRQSFTSSHCWPEGSKTTTYLPLEALAGGAEITVHGP